MKVSKKFEVLLDTYRRPSGRRWNGRELEDATGGVVTRSYVSALRKDVIGSPGYEKLRAIARAMGFPPELWFEELDGDAEAKIPEGRVGSIAERLERLFDTVKDERTGEPFTNVRVARSSFGSLSENDVEEIRTGRMENPTVEQILALSEVFGVAPAYFLERNKKPPLLSEEAMRVLDDKKSLTIANKSLGLSEGEKELVIEMIERLGRLHNGAHGNFRGN